MLIIMMYKGKLSYLEKLTPKLGKTFFGKEIDGSRYSHEWPLRFIG